MDVRMLQVDYEYYNWGGIGKPARHQNLCIHDPRIVITAATVTLTAIRQTHDIVLINNQPIVIHKVRYLI